MERGLIVSREAIHGWRQKFGRDCAVSGDKWHLNEVFLTINGKRHDLWRAVDQDDNVLDMLVQSQCVNSG